MTAGEKVPTAAEVLAAHGIADFDHDPAEIAREMGLADDGHDWPEYLQRADRLYIKPMKQKRAVPTPYTVNGFGHGFHVIARMEPHGVAISASVACDRNEIETATFFVEACNNYHALQQRAAGLEARVAAMQPVINAASVLIGRDEDEEQDSEDDYEAMFKLREAILAYRAALATGEAR